jgi:hypothetical protein
MSSTFDRYAVALRFTFLLMGFSQSRSKSWHEKDIERQEFKYVTKEASVEKKYV